MAFHSATLCKLDVFQHNYDILNDLVEKPNEILENEMQLSIDMNLLSMECFTGSHVMPPVKKFQADGGLDQNITFLCTRISALALFLLSGSDHSIFFCGGSGGSYRIFCERSMSLLFLSFLSFSPASNVPKLTHYGVV